MAEPRTGPCAAWATSGDLCDPCADYSIDAALLNDALDAASEVLYELSNRQFPGTCEATVRPCAQYRPVDTYPMRSTRYVTGRGYGCGCQRRSECSCGGLSAIRLPTTPVTAITEVRVDGAVVDASLYRVDDYGWLVKLPDANDVLEPWPCCQRLELPDTEDETFSVTYEYGRTPPQIGITAAAVLACELVLACDPDTASKCRLPKRVQSITRQGVSMVVLDPFEFLDRGRTGIYEVDLFLSAYAPRGRIVPAIIASPDVGPYATRADT